LAALALSASANAQQPPQAEVTPRLTIPRVATPPTLEDYADGVARPDEAAVTQFFQREPGDGVPASQQTEAYLSYDAQNLYVIFIGRDAEPRRVRANMTKREAIMGDDLVGVILDTFHDRHRGYEFIVNPLGIQLDGMFTEGQNDDFSFDTVWHSEGRLTSFGYVVFIAIPFRSLRFPGQTAQDWGFALLRSIPRNNETSFWPYLTRRVAGFAQQLATLDGLRDVSPGRNMQLIPYGAFTGARLIDAPRGGYSTERDARGGIDGKMIVKDAFAVDATFNPDFSQVESDEPQVTINQRFEVFFPEKRPFFIENASFFATPFNLFHSRRIADPQFGARVTGRSGGWVVAGLAIDDRAPGAQARFGDPSAGTRTGIGVMRIQRELPQQSNIGILASVRDFGPRENQIAAADGRWKVNKHWVATGQAVYSHTAAPGAASLDAPAFSVELNRESRTFHVGGQYRDVGAGFRAPLGFVRRVDLRQADGYLAYTWWRKNSPILSFGPSVRQSAIWSHAGTLEEWETEVEMGVELKGGTEVEAGYNEAMERFAGTDFRKNEMSMRAGTAWLKWLEVSTHWQSGREINYYPAAGFAPFLANGLNAELGATVKPIAPLRIDGTYLFTRLSARGGVALPARGARIVDNHILRTRGSYQFTRELSLRAIVDYNTVLPDALVIRLEKERRLSADLLATYLVNPWTAIYVGYNDGYENVAFDPPQGGGLRRIDTGLTSTGRQFFVKASYLFRF
jgi:hypothetical protein